MPDIQSSVWHRGVVPFALVQYSHHAFAPHFHDHFVFMKVSSGVNLGVKERKEYVVDTENLLIINPGELHTGHSLNRARLVYYAMYPDVDALQEASERFHLKIDCTFGLKQSLSSDPTLNASFSRLFDYTSDHLDPLTWDSLFCDFLRGLESSEQKEGNRHLGNRKENEKFKKARQYLLDNYQQADISLSLLSQHVGASPFYLLRLFKAHSGLTPFEFIRNVRVEQAKKMLRYGTSLTQVAIDTGFYDQSHFIRCFRQVTGSTPGSYRPG